MPITLRLKSLETQWTVGEPVGIGLMIENQSRKTVRVPDPSNPYNWQPVFTVSGPGYDKPLQFSSGSARLLPEPASQTFQTLKLVGIKPGQTLERQIEVRADLRRLGDYTISASMQTSLGVVQSAPLTFIVSPPSQPTRTGPLSLGKGEPTVCWIVSGPSKSQLRRSLFLRGQKEDGGSQFVLAGSDLAGSDAVAVRPGAREPFATETDADLTEVIDWTGWRDDAALYAIQGIGEVQYPFLKDPILRFPLPADARLVPHALMSADQSLDVFLLSADGRTLQMARFFSPLEQYLDHKPQQEPHLAWSHPLSAPALTATAALAPAHAGSVRHLLWTSQQGDALLLGHVLASASGQPPADAPPVTLPHAFALPGCRPAVRVDASGVTHVAVLYAADASLRQISLAEVTYGADGRPSGAPVILPQTTLPEAASSAVVSYGRDQYGEEERISFRRDWLVLLPDGRVLFSLGGRAAQGPVSLGSALVLPLELASPATRTFVLTLDPKSGEGPRLARLWD